MIILDDEENVMNNVINLLERREEMLKFIIIAMLL